MSTAAIDGAMSELVKWLDALLQLGELPELTADFFEVAAMAAAVCDVHRHLVPVPGHPFSMIQPAIGLLVAAIDRVAEVAERVSRAAEAQDRSGFDAAMLELRGPAGRLYEVWDALLNEPHLRASSFVFKQMGERDAASGTVGVASTSYGGGQRGNRYSNK